MTRKGFDTKKHQRILTEILLDIVKYLDGKIAFKGGTAAQMFYKLPRLSLDLDFDILERLSQKDIDRIKAILQKHGTIKEFSDKYHTLFFLLDYEVNTPNIKIEFNKRVWNNNRYKTTWFLGVSIKIADETTMFTNKLVAIQNRRTVVARDIFDAYYFLKMGYPVNKALIKERTSKDFPQYIEYLISFIKKNYTSTNILAGLGEVLDKGQKSWVKTYLIKELINELKKLKDQSKVS